jgi:tetratricopeptide (TPR) repeat protein
MAPEDYDRLYELLNVEANFDPKFDIPYLLGGLVLAESPDHAQKALGVFERGKGEYPADWRFPFYIGYTSYFSLGETDTAGKAMAEAARLPGSPAYLPGLASRMLSEAREPEAAIALLDTIVREESDTARRSVLERRIREVTVERDLQILERAVEKYREKTGTVPSDLSALLREGILEGIPPEPNGGNYVIDSGGKVRSDRVSQRLRVFQKK